MDNLIFDYYEEQPTQEQLDQGLIELASKGLVDEALSCIVLGASVHAMDAEGLTALMKAAQNGHAKVIEMLIENEAEIDAPAQLRYQEKVMPTAVMYAADYAMKTKDCNVLLMLLKAGANFDLDFNLFNTKKSDISFTTPLIWAVYYDLTQVVHYLLSQMGGMNLIEVVDSLNAYAPLTYAVMLGHAQTAQVLIEAGANLKVTDHPGNSLVAVAVDFNHPQVLAILLHTGVFTANGTNSAGCPLLHLAVMKQNLDMVLVLLKFGANPNTIEPTFKKTCLHLAATKHLSEISDALLNAGANPLCSDNGCFIPVINCLDEINYKKDTENKFFESAGWPTLCRLLSAMPEKNVNRISDMSKKYSELIGFFKTEMKAIRTRQLAAFGLAEIKSFAGNLIDLGYNTFVSIFCKPDEVLPSLPKEMVAIIMCDPDLYPSWYTHRIVKDIKFILDCMYKVKPKYVAPLQIQENIEIPQTVIFSNPTPKRKADNDLDDRARSAKKLKTEDDVTEKSISEDESSFDEEMTLVSKKSSFTKK